MAISKFCLQNKPANSAIFSQSSKGNGYLTAISNPNALIVTVPNNNQQSLDHSFR